MSIREDLLRTARNIVCNDREKGYGPPENSFGLIGDFWTVFLRARNPGPLKGHEVAIMLDLMKTARLVASDGTHVDSWIDKAGYASCGAEAAGICLEGHPNYAPPGQAGPGPELGLGPFDLVKLMESFGVTVEQAEDAMRAAFGPPIYEEVAEKLKLTPEQEAYRKLSDKHLGWAKDPEVLQKLRDWRSGKPIKERLRDGYPGESNPPAELSNEGETFGRPVKGEAEGWYPGKMVKGEEQPWLG